MAKHERNMVHVALPTTLDERRRFGLQVGLVLAAGMLAFWNSLYGAFVFDDHGHIVGSREIRQLWPISTWLADNARPVVTLTLAMNYRFGRLDPGGYHVVNLLIHLAAALTLFGIVRRTLGREPLTSTFGEAGPWLACAVSLLWVVHPLQTQSVTYVIQRGESLMGLFYLLTLYGFIRGAEHQLLAGATIKHRQSAGATVWYLASILTCALGMASKAVVVTGPILVLLYDRIFVSQSIAEMFRRRWAYYLGLLLTFVVVQFLGLFNSVLNPNPGYPVSVGFGMTSVTWWDYLRTQPEVILHYLRLVFWPHPLCLDYEWPVAQSGYYAQGFILLALLAATGALLWKRPRLGFVATSFFIILGPSSSFIPVKDLAMEHRMYLPLASVIVLVVMTGHSLLAGAATRPQRRKAHATQRSEWAAGAGLVLLAAGTLALATHQRNKAYYSGVELWRDVLRNRPDSPRALFGLGAALIQAGRPEEAAKHLEEAVRLKPDNLSAMLNLAQALAHQGKLDAAIAKYRELLRLDPAFAEARNNLGATLSRKGDFPAAIAEFDEVIRLEPTFINAHVQKGKAMIAQGRLEEAVTAIFQGVQVAPDSPEARLELANLLVILHRSDEAMTHYRQALRVRPDLAEARLYLGNCLAEQGRFAEAVREYEEAVRLKPGDAEANNALGSGLIELGRLSEALTRLDAALQIDPRNTNALLNRGSAKRAAGLTNDAITDFRIALQIDPNHAIGHNLLGSALLAQNQLGPAIAELGEALRLNPNLSEALYEMGMALEKSERPEDAAVAYREVVRMNPLHEQAAARLRAMGKF